MRLSFAVLAFVVSLGSASAAETIADQAQRAYSVFAGGLSEQDFLTARLGAVVLKDIAGSWVRLSGPGAKTGVETYGADSERFCKGLGVLTLASPNPITMTLSAKPIKSEFQQIYTLIAGATFAEHTDPLGYFEAIGLGPDKTGEAADQQRALALSLANQHVQLYRPSDDILVIVRDAGYPNVLARCPRG
ncbi:MAG: hypothetical protein ABIQ30_07425 [Devosia sp.]